ncbi:MAG: hypothetical protein ACLSFT_03010 [Ruminococcus callidus]
MRRSAVRKPAVQIKVSTLFAAAAQLGVDRVATAVQVLELDEAEVRKSLEQTDGAQLDSLMQQLEEGAADDTGTEADHAYELLSEKKVMEQLERSYQKALEDVKDRLWQLDERTDVENRQAVAYQKAFQQGLQKQLERILGKLHSKTYRTVQEYLQDCYLTGHTAVLYELQSDGLRLSLPVPQDKVCQAAVNDTKLVKPLYDSIGEDFAGLKKHITDIVSPALHLVQATGTWRTRSPAK